MSPSGCRVGVRDVEIDLIRLILGFMLFGVLFMAARFFLRRTGWSYEAEYVIYAIRTIFFVFWLLGEIGIHSYRIRIG